MNTTTTANAVCNTCTFWDKKNETTGECHRYAPQTISFVVDSETKIESRFPVTAAEDYCGEYRAK